MKMKKSHLSITLAFPLPSPFWFPQHILLKIAPTNQFFGNFISLLEKRFGTERGYRTMCIHLQVSTIFNSFCVFLLIWILQKYSELPFLWPNKTEDKQYVPSYHWTRITNPSKLFEPNKPKGNLSFSEVKILGQFTVISLQLFTIIDLQLSIYNHRFTITYNYWSYTSLEISLSFYKDSHPIGP